MSVERATGIMHAAGMGTILSLIHTPPEQRDLTAADTARDVVIAAITMPPTSAGATPTDEGSSDVASTAMALRAALSCCDADVLSAAEKPLLIEWLNRLADARPESAASS